MDNKIKRLDEIHCGIRKYLDIKDYSGAKKYIQSLDLNDVNEVYTTLLLTSPFTKYPEFGPFLIELDDHFHKICEEQNIKLWY
jgi:hypothetical protein